MHATETGNAQWRNWYECIRGRISSMSGGGGGGEGKEEDEEVEKNDDGELEFQDPIPP